ncbi:MAG: arylsulfotransferase family protein [Gemmatimonadota bacterium]
MSTSRSLDACSEVVWKLREDGHHAVHRASDGTFWIPGLSHPSPPRSERVPEGYPGLEDPVYHVRLLNVSADGELLRDVDVLDVLHENGLWDHVELRFRRSDVVHTNDVEPLPDTLASEYPAFESGDPVVSLRDANLVFVLDPETREVKWHADGPFRLQHDPDFTGDGRIGVFDNQWDGREDRRAPGDTSRIVSLDVRTGEHEVLFPRSRSEPFFTAHRGKWDRLENGNLLLVEADAGRVVEVAPDDGRTVWEWVAEPYDETHVPGVANAVRHDLTREDVAEWPCSEVE